MVSTHSKNISQIGWFTNQLDFSVPIPGFFSLNISTKKNRDKFWQALDLHCKTLQWERWHNPTFPGSLEHYRLKKGGYLYSIPGLGICFNYKIHQFILPSFYPPVNKHSNGKSPSWIGEIHLQMVDFPLLCYIDYLSVFLCKPFLWLPNSIWKNANLSLRSMGKQKPHMFFGIFLGWIHHAGAGWTLAKECPISFYEKNCTEFFCIITTSSKVQFSPKQLRPFCSFVIE